MLKKALATLLYDRFTVDSDLNEYDCDETFIDNIIRALIEGNNDGEHNTCPFKNYDCIDYCKHSMAECEKGTLITCTRDIEDIWRSFIGLDEMTKATDLR